MSSEDPKTAGPGGDPWTFPAWHNKVPPLIFGVVGPLATVVVIAAVTYYFSPSHTDVGYRPEQPVPYSHKLHVGDLGIDCRYCHTGVERTAHAGVPPTQTCMNCHSSIKTDSELLAPVRKSWETGAPIEWVRIHKTPDYAYFQHDSHIKAGVGCESCHGRVDQMVEVVQAKPLSMGWCIDCHTNPGPNLRPLDQVTAMGYVPNKGELGEQLAEKYAVNPPIHCSGCHR